MLIINNDVKSTQFKNNVKPVSNTSTQAHPPMQKTLTTAPTELLKAYYLPSKSVNFQGIKILKMAQNFELYQPQLQRELSDLDDIGNNVTFLGKGLWAEASKFDNLPFVIKKLSKKESELPSRLKTELSARNADIFDIEIEGMNYVANILPETQRFVAKAIDDNGVKYLISTFVEGFQPDPQEHPFTRIHFKSLFETMFKLDKEGVYHGDLNPSNIKLKQKGDVDFIDYQWTSKVHKSNFFDPKERQEFPRFRFLENDQMFQMAGLSHYLKNTSNEESKGLLKDYLFEKAEYHKNRGQYIETLLPNWAYSSDLPFMAKAIDFEDAQHRVFQNPTNDVILVEAQKLDLNNAMRNAFTLNDRNLDDNNIISGTTAAFYALENAQRFQSNLRSLKSNPNSDAMNRYLNHQIEELDYWKPKLIEKAGNAFADIKYEIKYSFDTVKNRKINFSNFGQTQHLGQKIDYSLGCLKSEVVDVKTSEFLTAAKKTGKTLKNTNQIVESLTSPEAIEAQKTRKEALNAFYMAMQSTEENKYLNTLTSSIYGMFCAQNYKTKLVDLLETEARTDVREQIIKERNVAASLLESFEDMSNKTFDTIYKKLSNNFWEYKDMNNFDIKLSNSGIAAAKKYMQEDPPVSYNYSSYSTSSTPKKSFWDTFWETLASNETRGGVRS